jgi:hypothetical protein
VNTKLVTFLTTIWFVSMMVCALMEGTYFGVLKQGILDDLRMFTKFDVGPWFSARVFSVRFI